MSEEATVEVDSRGRLCPLPVIDLARAARHSAPGDLIDLVADDPAAASDVQAWCGMRGHTLVSAEPFDDESDDSDGDDSDDSSDEAVVSWRDATVYRIRIEPRP